MIEQIKSQISVLDEMLANFHRHNDHEHLDLTNEDKEVLWHIMETNLSVQQKLQYMCDKFGYKHPNPADSVDV